MLKLCRKWFFDRDGLTIKGMAVLIILIFLSSTAIVLLALHHDQKSCEAKGGHLLTEPGYKSVVELCISPDGRIIN